MARPILTVIARAVLAFGITAPADSAGFDGEKLFKRKCGACHFVTNKKKLGPGLAGVFGRTAGTFKPFNYSRAMKAAGRTNPPLVWSTQTIDAYLTNPKQYIPTNKMSLRPIRKPEERAAILTYMEQATAAQ